VDGPDKTNCQRKTTEMASTQKLVGSLVGKIGHLRGAAVQEKWAQLDVVVPRRIYQEIKEIEPKTQILPTDLAPLPRERWTSTSSSRGNPMKIGTSVIQKTEN
jgi:hypothetical protein